MLQFAGCGGSPFPPDNCCGRWNKIGQTITIDGHNDSSEGLQRCVELAMLKRGGIDSLKQTELQLLIVEG